MLVRRNRVVKALERLKLNHIDYADLNISYNNLAAYLENEPWVIVNYTQTIESNQNAESTVVNNLDKDEDTEKEDCLALKYWAYIHGTV